MAHINLLNPLPGISGLLTQYPATARPLSLLAETLLREPHSLTSGERELIAAYTSYKNQCHFCHSCHAAAATTHLGDQYQIIDAVNRDVDTAPISEKMKALLHIAAQVSVSGRAVTPAAIERAKAAAATDDEIHMAVLIAAAFCMYNRYVDGLGTWAPEPREAYAETGERLAHVGYVKSME